MAIKKVLFIVPCDVKVGQPSFERIASFRNVYAEQGVVINSEEQPRGFMPTLNLLAKIANNKYDEIFISMPSFRCWWLFLLPFQSIIFDIRDGWSISMKSGYGGKFKPKTTKAYLARKIERFAIKRSKMTITCTNGLQSYLQELSQKEIYLVTNGVSLKDVDTVNSLKEEGNNTTARHTFNFEQSNLIAVCVGQFSEYGEDKVITLMKKLSEKFTGKSILVQLIGSDYSKNKWIKLWLKDKGINNIEIEFIERLNRKDMYQKLLVADLSLLIVRDPSYEFGTKVYDYILCGLPIFNYFSERNNFTDYFQGHFFDDTICKKNIVVREYEIFNRFFKLHVQ